MAIVEVTKQFSVSAQPTIEEIETLASLGFTALINNRPDAEEAEQPGNAAEAAAARRGGLAYLFLPVKTGAVTEAQVHQFTKFVNDSEGAVLAHCKSGTRSLTLWTLGEVLAGRMAASDIGPFGRGLGFNLEAAEKWAAEHANAGTGR